MPFADTYVEAKNGLASVLAYGDAKRKKTWWALTAAQAGYNVLLFNSDENGADIVQQIPAEARKRIRILDLSPKMGEVGLFASFLTLFLKGDQVLWNDTRNTVSSAMRQENNYFILEARKFTPNDVIICDNWTSLVQSVIGKLAKDKNTDLSEIDKLGWEMYASSGMYLNWVLEQWKAIQCHKIIIGHGEVAERYKTKKGGDPTKMQDKELISTKIQPISSSRAQAVNLAKYFDILYFFMIGNQFKISSSSDEMRDGGSRIIPPDTYAWDNLSFGKYAELGGLQKADSSADMPGCVYRPAGSADMNQAPVTTATASAPVLQSTPQMTTGKPSGLLNLLNKGKQP